MIQLVLVSLQPILSGVVSKQHAHISSFRLHSHQVQITFTVEVRDLQIID